MGYKFETMSEEWLAEFLGAPRNAVVTPTRIRTQDYSGWE